MPVTNACNDSILLLSMAVMTPPDSGNSERDHDTKVVACAPFLEGAMMRRSVYLRMLVEIRPERDRSQKLRPDM